MQSYPTPPPPQHVNLQQVYSYYEKDQNPQTYLQPRMAPSQTFKINHQKFINFQRLLLFQGEDEGNLDFELLSCPEVRKLLKIVQFLFEKWNEKIIGTQDLKGAWVVIGFLFDRRTGLFLNEFFLMMVHDRLNLEMYHNQETIREIKFIIDSLKQTEWFSSEEFLGSIQVLLNQPKTSQKQQLDEIYKSFTKLITTLSQPYPKQIENFFEKMNKFGILTKVKDDKLQKQYRQQINLELVPNFSIFDPEDQFVLSQPDTFVADVYQVFEESQYRRIRRKMSINDEMLSKFSSDDQTQMMSQNKSPKQTHKNDPTTAKIKQKQSSENQTSTKFKRKIHFDITNPNAPTSHMFTSSQQDSNTVVKGPRKQFNRPPRQMYFQNMFQTQTNNFQRLKNFRYKINQRNQEEQGKRARHKRNYQIEKEIRKIIGKDNFRDRDEIGDQNRNNRNKSRNSNRRGISRNSREISMRVDNFVEDQSQDSYKESQSRMEMEDEDVESCVIIESNSRAKPRQRKSGNKRNDINENKLNPKTKSKPKPSQYRKHQNLISQQSLIQQPDQRTRQKPLNPKNHLKKNLSREKQRLKEDNQKRVSSYKKLRKHADMEQEQSSQKIVNEEDFIDVDGYEEMQDSKTVNINVVRRVEAGERRVVVNNSNPPYGIAQQKYSHLLHDPCRQLNTNNPQQRNTRNTLDNFITRQPYPQNPTPLHIRPLSILQFQHQAGEMHMQLQPNPHHLLRQELSFYEQLNQVKMSFGIQEYLRYVMSFQNKDQVFKQIKQLSSEYLSIVFTRRESVNVNNQLVEVSDKGMDRADKLILVARKIIAMHVMAANQEQIKLSEAQQRFFCHNLTYIRPLVEHFLYTITVQLLAEVINSLYTSQGDEDFEQINKVSLPFMMLFYDIRQLYQQQKTLHKDNTSKNLFGYVYKTITTQFQIILTNLLTQANLPSTPLHKSLTQKLTLLLKDHNLHSNIYLPRVTLGTMTKLVKQRLPTVKLVEATMAAVFVTEARLYDKVKFMLRISGESDLAMLNTVRRQFYGDKGCIVNSIESLLQTVIVSDNKGISSILSITKTLYQTVSNIPTAIQPDHQFTFQSKTIILLAKHFKQSSRLPIPPRRPQPYEQSLTTLKQFLNLSLTRYITCKLSVLSFRPIVNMVQTQKLKELMLDQNLSVGNAYVYIELNLEVLAVFMGYQQFCNDQMLNKPQILKVIEKVLNETRQSRNTMFAARNRDTIIIKKIFDLLIKGYTHHLWEKGHIWNTNDELFKATYQAITKKDDLIAQYWVLIKELFRTVYEKLIQHQQASHSPSALEVQRQRFKAFSTLFTHISTTLFTPLVNHPSGYTQLLNSKQPMSLSLRHILFNLLPLMTEHSCLIDLEMTDPHVKKALQLFSSPCKMVAIVSKLTMIEEERELRGIKYEDEDEREDDLMMLEFKRNKQNNEMAMKCLEIAYMNLAPVRQLQINLQNYFKRQQSIQQLGYLTIIQSLKYFQLIKPQPLSQPPQKQPPNQPSKPTKQPCSLFTTILKKHQFLCWHQSSNLSRVITEKQLHDLENVFGFLKAVGRMVSELAQGKVEKENRVVETVLRKLIVETNLYRVNILAMVNGVVLRKLVIMGQKDNKEVATIMKLYNKVYQVSKNLSPNPNLNTFIVTDLQSLLYLLYKSQTSKPKLESSPFSQLMNLLLLYSQNTLPQPHPSCYSKSTLLLTQYLYNFMKSLSSYIHTQRPINRLEQDRTQHQTLFMIAISYMKLFNTIVAWPQLLLTRIDKIRTEIQCLSVKGITEMDLAGKSCQGYSYQYSRSLLDYLIPVNNHYKNTQDNDIKDKDLALSVNLIIQCIHTTTHHLQANIYKLKQTIPNNFFIYLIKRIILSQLYQSSNSSHNSSRNGLQLLKQSRSHVSSQKKLTQLTLLKQLCQALEHCPQQSTPTAQSLLQSLLHSFLYHLKPHPIIKPQPVTFQFQQQLFKLAKTKLPNFIKRVLYTFFVVVKSSTKARQVVEKVFEQFSIEINGLLEEFQGKEELEMVERQSANCRSLIGEKQSMMQSIEHVIEKCMITPESDFYIIKKLIFARAKAIVQHVESSDNISSSLQCRILSLIKTLQKTITITSSLNDNMANQNKNCNRDLQQSFREKIDHLINLAYKLRNSKMLTINGSLDVWIREEERKRNGNVDSQRKSVKQQQQFESMEIQM